MKKALKNNFKTIIVAVIASVVTSVTSIFAYSLIAENVGYTPKDTTWNVKNVEAALNNLNLRENQLSTYYSTEEQVVGEWIDGKPLYQKTLVSSYSGSTGSGEVTVATFTGEAVDIDTAVYGVVRCNANRNMNKDFNGYGNFAVRTEGNDVIIVALRNLNNVTGLIATIQYTKTTD